MHLEHSGFCCCFPTVVASSLSLCLLALQSYHFSRLLTSEGGKICKSQRSFDKQRRKGPNNKGCVLICFTSYLAITWVQWEPPVKAGSKWLFFYFSLYFAPLDMCICGASSPAWSMSSALAGDHCRCLFVYFFLSGRAPTHYSISTKVSLSFSLCSSLWPVVF